MKTMAPVEVRNECNRLVKAYRASWGQGQDAMTAAAKALKAHRNAFPWLQDQIPFDVMQLALDDAAL